MTSNTRQSRIKEQRRVKLQAANATLIGIDYIKVLPLDPKKELFRNLELYFVGKEPDPITDKNIQITEGLNRIATSFKITIPSSANKANDKKITIQLEASNSKDFDKVTEFTLTLINLTNVDPFFKQVKFSLQAIPTAKLDCQTLTTASKSPIASPEIDYLTKDYESFRQLMLNRLSTLIPGWQTDSEADLGVALIEAMAYAADQLSYYQDAVATEAYLGTARRRVSVKRHARLLDYNMHEGVNARVWVYVEVNNDIKELEKGTVLFTRSTGVSAKITTKNYSIPQLSEVFETMYPVTLKKLHNEMQFYRWGAEKYNLQKGAVKATLEGSYSDLKKGDILLFEEVKGANTGKAEDARPSYRHIVRLSKVLQTEDKLFNKKITEIEWYAQDALPFCLCIASTDSNNKSITNISVARGNMVLADHGRSYSEDALVPNKVPKTGVYHPYLKRKNITFTAPFDLKSIESQAAKIAIQQDIRLVQPVVQLKNGNDIWYARNDLLSSNRLSQDFVVEIENDRRAFLRFGDGEFAKRPIADTEFLTVNYRVGNAAAGNIGADTLAHIMTTEDINKIRNPLPAQGGIDPELVEKVRLNAPKAFQRRQRTVTAADYAEITAKHPEVKRAAATLRWLGSWNIFFVSVERLSGQTLDTTFKQQIKLYLQGFRLINHEIEVVDPEYVPLNIVLVVQVKEGYLFNVVQQSLQEKFSNQVLSDGTLGFFHANNFGFGKSVYLSQIISTALTVSGVDYINTNAAATRFQRQSDTLNKTAIDEGKIAIGELEIAQVLNDQAFPEKGRIQFIDGDKL